MYKFWVTDTGIGIKKESQQKIFGSFTQADGSTTREYGGTGLGLTISEQIVRLFGGNIGVESEIDEGSKFWFTAGFKRSESNKKLIHDSPLKGMRVFIDTSNTKARNALKEHVKGWGCNVVTREGSGVIPAADVAILDLSIIVDNNLTSHEVLSEKVVDAKSVIMLFPIIEKYKAREIKGLNIIGRISRPVRRNVLFDILLTFISKGKVSIPGNEKSIQDNASKFNSERNLKILLVEDNVINQQVVVATLQKYGCMVDVANNGGEAINRYKTFQYDLIFMDCQMPVVDGFEATKIIRKYEKETGKERIPIVALTANALETDRQACLQSGMDDFVIKPIRLKMLPEIFNRFVMEEDNPLKIKSEQSYVKSISDHIDQEIISELKKLLDHDQLLDVTKLFVEHVEERLEQLHKAVKQNDLTEVESISHSMKGSSANMGAILMSRMCNEIMESTQTGNLSDQINESLDQLEKEFLLVKDYLQEHLAQV
jgi:CheY-like chemotaxis protein